MFGVDTCREASIHAKQLASSPDVATRTEPVLYRGASGAGAHLTGYRDLKWLEAPPYSK